MAPKFVKNAVGRMIPEKINGKPVIPFQGVHKYITDGKRYAPPLPSASDRSRGSAAGEKPKGVM